MKSIILIFNIIILSVIVKPVFAQGIEFEKGTWQDMLAIAEKTDKLVFVDAYATWCGPCKMMSSYTFTDEAVGEFYNKHFINYKYDMESTAGEQFADEYEVTAYPTLLFINGKGEVMHRRTGYYDSVDFLELGRGIIYPEESEWYKMTQRFKAGERDTVFLFDYVLALNKANKPFNQPLDIFFSLFDTTDLILTKPFSLFYICGIKDYENKFTQYFTNNYFKFKYRFGSYAFKKSEEIMEANAKIAGQKSDKQLIRKMLTLADKAYENHSLNEQKAAKNNLLALYMHEKLKLDK